MKTYNETTSTPTQTVTLGEGAYLHTSQAGAWVPLQRAVISGVIVGVLVAIVIWRLQPAEWLFAASLAGVITVAVTWAMFQLQWSRLVGLIEIMTRRDLDNDGYIGDELEPTVRPVRIDMQEFSAAGAPTTTIRATFASQYKMMLLAQHIVIDNLPFSEPSLTGKGKLFSPAEYAEVRSEMIARGMLVARNPTEPKQGYAVTRAGMAALRDLASNPPTPDFGIR